MKHFKLVGPLTTREFDIEDDEIVCQFIIKIDDYQHGIPQDKIIRYQEQNIKISDTEPT